MDDRARVISSLKLSNRNRGGETALESNLSHMGDSKVDYLIVSRLLFQYLVPSSSGETQF